MTANRSAVMSMGSNMPVDAFPPKIIAITGTTIMETPGTPVFDIPTSIAQIPISIQLVYDKDKTDEKSGIPNNFLV